MKTALSALIFLPAFASAQVIITEVMYDLESGSDSGREWVEVYNVGTAAVSFSEWKLFENGINHKITGAGSLPPGAYAVVADNAEKFKADWPLFSGPIYDSAFSLSNDGDTVSLRTGAGTDIDSFAYTNSMGAKGTGDSLQRDGAAWGAGMPTPGTGIPAGGLVPTPVKPSKKSQAAAVAATPEVRGEAVARTKTEIRTATTTASSFLWWLGPALIAATGGAGMTVARHFRRDEWEIEEFAETG